MTLVKSRGASCAFPVYVNNRRRGAHASGHSPRSSFPRVKLTDRCLTTASTARVEPGPGLRRSVTGSIGGSHVIFQHATGAMLSVLARRPIKSVYVKKFVRLIEDGIAE